MRTEKNPELLTLCKRCSTTATAITNKFKALELLTLQDQFGANFNELALLGQKLCSLVDQKSNLTRQLG